MRKCTKCGIEKELSEFHKNKTRHDNLSSWCKTCQTSHKKIHYEKYKEIYKNNFHKNSKWWFDFKKNLKCERCGFSHPAALDFHHKDPTTKQKGFTFNRNCYIKRKDEILKEIEKCEVLCSNCHRIEHSHWYNDYLEKENKESKLDRDLRPPAK